MNDLEKAQKVIVNKMGTLKNISEQVKIPYPTLRNYVKEPKKMENAAWKNVYKIARVYDKLTSRP